jgi:hypothetical protein
VTLPACQHRGDTLDTPAGQRHECYHIHVRGREQVQLISTQFCLDCGYSNHLFDIAPSRYLQPQAAQPTEAEYVAHWGICQSCNIRQGNYCPHAMGICPLSQKLGKGDFGCPHGKFKSVQEERAA